VIAIEVKQVKAGEQPSQVIITLDDDGLRTLLAQLKFLVDGRTDHLDLMSEAWGGTFLEDRPRGDYYNYPVHYAKVMLARPRKPSSSKREAVQDEWVVDSDLSINPELLGRIRQRIEDVSAVIVEHRFYRAGSAPHRFVFDSYDALDTYLRERTRPGDSFYFWEYESCCTDANFMAHGKVPNDEGKVPRRGSY
jgi:hypothetical protein